MITSVGAFASSLEKLGGFEEGESSDQRTGKILFVDDNSINRIVMPKILKKSLKGLGLLESYTVKTATDGQEAVNMAEKTLYDLIIMDMQMPNKDGIEATIEIKIEPSE